MRFARFLIFLPLAFFCALPLRAEEDALPPLPPAPRILTSVTPDQLSADYWIARLADPDRLLKTPEEIRGFNEDIHAMIKECVDIFAMEKVRRGAPIRDQLELEYRAVSGRKLFGADDQYIPRSFFEETIRPLDRYEDVPEKIRLRWGAAVRQASVRALPSDVKMLELKGDIEFDQLQFTQIKLWTPVAVYHESTDGNWFYIQAPYTRGWVRARDIALFDSREELKKYAKAPDFLVVTGESIALFDDAALTAVLARPSMGTILPVASKAPGAPYTVWIPERGAGGKAALRKAYAAEKADVSAGFLSFTQRNIIRQAFKLLGARYGWGGTYNGRDCSGFTQDVYLPFGIDMPRSSKMQRYIGTQIDHFEYKEDAERKKAALENAVPGLTLMSLPKHQMIFLGSVNGQYYVIHSTWAERISMTSDEKNRINQVVVSDLSLNGSSYLGSLFERIVDINEID